MTSPYANSHYGPCQQRLGLKLVKFYLHLYAINDSRDSLIVNLHVLESFLNSFVKVSLLIFGPKVGCTSLVLAHAGCFSVLIGYRFSVMLQ